jgi:hypothetical protein
MRAQNSFITTKNHLSRGLDGNTFVIVIVIYKIEYYYSLLYDGITLL